MYLSDNGIMNLIKVFFSLTLYYFPTAMTLEVAHGIPPTHASLITSPATSGPFTYSPWSTLSLTSPYQTLSQWRSTAQWSQEG